jgi:hypothetical protein
MFILDRKNILSLSIFFILIGIFLRFYQLNFENYWFDELIDFWVADPNISFNATFFRRDELIEDQTPYLFQLFLKIYLKFFGYDPEIGRHVPLIFGVLSIPLVGILSYQVAKNNSFLLTILLVSINIYLIKYSQETRTYTLVFLLSTINLIFYYKIIFSDLTYFKKIYIFSLFVIFSVLGLSAHPFVFIIFFSQIAYSVYSIFVFREKNFLFVLSIPFILIIYLVINYNYLISQFSYNEYFLEHENWKFYFDYYFSRFFGSKIMGLIYLSILIFLIIRFRKIILFTSNNYLPLIFILFFSYIIPIFYALLKTPVLTDRYIIFVLIPILILISALIFEIDNKKLKIFLLISILIPTIINNYIEIKYRLNTKPEFTKLLNILEKHETKNLTVYAPKVPKVIDEIIENYILSIKVFKNKNFKILNIDNISSDTKMLWVICYEPVVAYNCNISSGKRKNWILNETKKLHLLKAQLYEIKN